ncbi:MAG: hypothetical protein ROZ37_04835 [Aromatoleum sp.]|uniref:hypothetical protein n=1 Tax=Aromatoleum sp. TaxID=2307007 RepID=UPI002893D457|nr:hypothetical protein [Aromatoleum sp.]MDT3669643.1 hypothetical protein [Aromatoleum sp.]
MSNRTPLRPYVEPSGVRTLRLHTVQPTGRSPTVKANPANVLMRAMQALLARKYPTP